MPKALTANRLIDGEVVYLDAGGEWASSLSGARLIADGDKAAAQALEAQGATWVAKQTVVNPYLIDVAEEGGRIALKSAREIIRAKGPSVRPDLGKQAAG